MEGICDVTGPGTKAHRWLTMIQDCPLSAQRNRFIFLPDMITDRVGVCTKLQQIVIFTVFFFIFLHYYFILQMDQCYTTNELPLRTHQIRKYFLLLKALMSFNV